MALYSEKVMDHFTHPRNVGIIENADGVGEVGNAKCGDIMKIYLKIDDGIISDVKFETFGCGSVCGSLFCIDCHGNFRGNDHADYTHCRISFSGIRFQPSSLCGSCYGRCHVW